MGFFSQNQLISDRAIKLGGFNNKVNTNPSESLTMHKFKCSYYDLGFKVIFAFFLEYTNNLKYILT